MIDRAAARANLVNAVRRIVDALEGGALKYNENHDERGRFASSDSAGSSGGGTGRAQSKEEWVKGLTQPEKDAIQRWGASGRAMRQLQSGGDLTGIDRTTLDFARRDLPNLQSALDKGVTYSGTVYRGLSNVPYGAIEEWNKEGQVELKNDQSATTNGDVGSSAASTGYGDQNSVVWEINQDSGVDLAGQTKVTMGGKSIAEHEIIIRQGTRYQVGGLRFIKSDGTQFPPPDYFEGTDYSWPGNPPPDWHPGKDTRGHYVMSLKEIK
jgi:hypothetical protein